MSDLKTTIGTLEQALHKFTPGFYNVEAIDYFDSAINEVKKIKEISTETVNICNEISDNVHILYSKHKYKEFGGLGRVKMRIAHSIRRLNQLTNSIQF